MDGSWIGIRLSAVLGILGSLVTLLAAAGFLFAAWRAEDASNLTRGLLTVLALFFGVLAGWGLATAGGIFRRREWARLSMIIFSMLLMGMGISALIGIVFIRVPEASSPTAWSPARVRLTIAVGYACITLIGGWWLLLFSSAGAKRYFSEPRLRERRLSIDVIGWSLLATALLTAAAAMLRLPVVVFGLVVTNWAALAVYTVFTAAEIYLGSGLLGRSEPTRLGAIGYFGFAVMNLASWAALPGFNDRMQTVLEAMPRILRPTLGASAEILGPVIWLVCASAAVPIWFLIRCRSEFPETRS